MKPSVLSVATALHRCYPLPDYQLVINVSSDPATALAGWRRLALLIGLGSALVIAILLGLFQILRVTVRQAGRQCP